MEAKGVIRRQVQWAQSRTFFYWRLRRRLWEFEVAASLRGSGLFDRASPQATRKEVSAMLKEWFTAAATAQAGSDRDLSVWDDDSALMGWLEAAPNKASLKAFLARKRDDALSLDLARRLEQAVTVGREGDAASRSSSLKATLTEALRALSPEAQALLKDLAQSL